MQRRWSHCYCTTDCKTLREWSAQRLPSKNAEREKCERTNSRRQVDRLRAKIDVAERVGAVLPALIGSLAKCHDRCKNRHEDQAQQNRIFNCRCGVIVSQESDQPRSHDDHSLDLVFVRKKLKNCGGQELQCSETVLQKRAVSSARYIRGIPGTNRRFPVFGSFPVGVKTAPFSPAADRARPYRNPADRPNVGAHSSA